MPSRDPGSSDVRRCAKSPLGDVLLRLQQSLEQARAGEASAERQFDIWQERWSEHREQISRRLELIDTQLDALVRDRESRPQLSVVGDEEGQ